MMEAPDPVVLTDKRRRAEGIRLSNVILSRHLKGAGSHEEDRQPPTGSSQSPGGARIRGEGREPPTGTSQPPAEGIQTSRKEAPPADKPPSVAEVNIKRPPMGCMGPPPSPQRRSRSRPPGGAQDKSPLHHRSSGDFLHQSTSALKILHMVGQCRLYVGNKGN